MCNKCLNIKLGIIKFLIIEKQLHLTDNHLKNARQLRFLNE